MHVLFLRIINRTFENKKQARLINPTKMELSLISKDIIQRIVSKILNNLRYILW